MVGNRRQLEVGAADSLRVRARLSYGAIPPRWSCTHARRARPLGGLPIEGALPMLAGSVRWIVSFAFVSAVPLLLVSAGARPRRPSGTPALVQVITPAPGATVPAHPDVNVIVMFTAGVPGSVRARLNARDVTRALQPMTDQGTQVGLRGVLRHAELRLGSHRTNRLKLLVHARQADAQGPTARPGVHRRLP